MEKNKLLLVIPHMTIGGVQKTLISALKAIDYDKYDVTLYLRKNRTRLLEFVDRRVTVIVNEDPGHYYRKPFALALQLCSLMYRFMRCKEKASRTDTALADRIREAEMDYEKRTYFNGVKYDKVIAYVQGYTALFVDKCVNADEKIIFYHTSTNDLPEMHKAILPHFKKIAALHPEQKQLIGEWYPEHSDKITVVENYTDQEMIIGQSCEYTVPKKNKAIVICSCGRLAPVKGFDMAVDAAKILKDNGKDFIWYFVGDGPERNNIEQNIKEHGLEKNIVLTGMQTNPYPYMSCCDIYVQPSYEEALGLTILEAHRLNKPVISTATVGGCKLVENGTNGIICQIKPEAIAESITELIIDTEKYKRILTNLKTTDYSHEFEKYKAQWKALLEG